MRRVAFALAYQEFYASRHAKGCTLIVEAIINSNRAKPTPESDGNCATANACSGSPILTISSTGGCASLVLVNFFDGKILFALIHIAFASLATIQRHLLIIF